MYNRGGIIFSMLCCTVLYSSNTLYVRMRMCINTLRRALIGRAPAGYVVSFPDPTLEEMGAGNGTTGYSAMRHGMAMAPILKQIRAEHELSTCMNSFLQN